MADGNSRVPFAAKVRALDAEVSRDQRIVTRAQPQHGSIVTDAGEDRFTVGRARLPLDAANQLTFLKRHFVSIKIAVTIAGLLLLLFALPSVAQCSGTMLPQVSIGVQLLWMVSSWRELRRSRLAAATPLSNYFLRS